MGAVLRDLVIGPSVMPLRLRHLDGGDALGRVVLPHARHRGPHQSANSLKPMTLRGRLLDRGKHLLDVLALQKRGTLIAVPGAELFDDASARVTSVFGELIGPGSRVVVRDNKRVDCARQGSACPDLSARKVAVESKLIGRHKLLAARQSGKRNALTSRSADITPNFAVPVD